MKRKLISLPQYAASLYGRLRWQELGLQLQEERLNRSVAKLTTAERAEYARLTREQDLRMAEVEADAEARAEARRIMAGTNGQKHCQLCGSPFTGKGFNCQPCQKGVDQRANLGLEQDTGE